MSELATIDGSRGEGGGQILRTSLGLSLVTGRAVRIERIRAGRANPGLQRQHLAAVRAAIEVGAARAEGTHLGSSTLTFAPGPVRSGAYRFDVGSAGSATLVLQTVLPALALADGPSRVEVTGGTHNAWAPPFEFVERVYLPLLNRMGPHVEVRLERHGFHPAGQGRLVAEIRPSAAWEGFDLPDRGAFVRGSVRALVSRLPEHVGRRETETALQRLARNKAQRKAWSGQVEEVEAAGPGNAVLVEVVHAHAVEVFAGFGRRGVPAEKVALDAADEAAAYLATEVPVGPHLADQWLLPLGISAWQPGAGERRRGGSFRTGPPTGHTTTHIELLRQLLDLDIRVEEQDPGGSVAIRVGPRS